MNRPIIVIVALALALVSCVISSVSCAADDHDDDALIKDTASVSGADLARNFIEEGRTFVHHAIKRMAFLMPAVFFKLGIAMTLLVLVTIVAVNNGVIGFMLLVVGLSTVLARLQDARHASPVVLPPPHYAHFLDRSDAPTPTGPTASTHHNAHSTTAKHYDYQPYTQPQYAQYTDVVYNSRYHR